MKISVFTSCYNQGAYLKLAIESVLNQSYTNFEYLIYDDGSTDNTWSIIEEYSKKDSRIVPIKLDKQPNVGVVINMSIDTFTGDVWSWCPSDDLWHKDMLKEKVEYHQKYPEAVLYNDWHIIDQNGAQTGSVITTKYTPAKFKEIVWTQSPIGFTGIFIPRTVFSKVGKFPNNLKYSEDFYWMIKSTIHDIDYIGVPKILHYKRTHPNSLSQKNNTTILRQVDVIRAELREYQNRLNQPTIPKTIFFFWGNDKMSWMRYMTLKSFRMFNPNWKMILYCSPCLVNNKQWTGIEAQDFFCFDGVNYYEKINKLNIEIKQWDIADNTIIQADNIPTIGASHKSNFFKWCKLHEDGGIYSDLDIIYFKPIDSFYNKLVEGGYNTAICQTSDLISIGLLASTKNNDFFKDIFVHAFKSYTPKNYQSAGILTVLDYFKCTIGNILETAIIKYPEIKFYNMPMNLVYPLDSKQIEYAFTHDIHIKDLPETSIGYHWYAGHPICQKYNNILDENNYKEYNFTFANIAKEILSNE